MIPAAWPTPELRRARVAAPVAGTPGATLAAEAILRRHGPDGQRAVRLSFTGLPGGAGLLAPVG